MPKTHKNRKHPKKLKIKPVHCEVLEKQGQH